jgi:hypothetical protein
MSRRLPQSPPHGGAACCPGKLNDEESQQDESEQEDISIKPKKKVQKGIMSSYKKKEKKHGQGCPWKVPPPPPQPAKKQEVDKAKTCHQNNYSDPAVAAARQEAVEFYVSTGGKFPTRGDALLTNQPIINIPKRTIKRDAEKLSHTNKPKENNSTPARLNSGGNAVVMASHDNSRSLTSESTRAFIAQTAKRRNEAQIGMTHKEVIHLMMHLTGGTSDQCENHYDYLIRKRKMPELKNHGRVQRVQQTMTKCSCIRIEQHFCWHMTIETI